MDKYAYSASYANRQMRFKSFIGRWQGKYNGVCLVEIYCIVVMQEKFVLNSTIPQTSIHEHSNRHDSI